MANKTFKIPSQCKSLTSYFRKLKEDAREELKQNGVHGELSKASPDALQNVCDHLPNGAFATYVLELQKCFRMSENELLDYDQIIEQRQNSPSADDDDLWSDDGSSEEDLWEDDLTSGPFDFD